VSFGVIEQLRRSRPDAKFLELVHRLDKETSGVLLIAKKRSALTSLQDQFRARETEKTYAVLVWGQWPRALKVLDTPLIKTVNADGERHVKVAGAGKAITQEGAKRAISLVRVVQTWTGFSLLDVTIKTGRTHQIRVHLAHEGHAIVGDPKYGDFDANRTLARGQGMAGIRFDRMFLHARRLAFQHPSQLTPCVVESPLPRACETLLRALGAARRTITPKVLPHAPL
jgi:23S rRNA pseudouridine955/2504/2580 synthase